MTDGSSKSVRSARHAVVIGAGFGGLAAAVRLGARGYRVTLLEALDRPGGRARVLREGGHTFDLGPTIITAPFLLEELWRLADRSFAGEISLSALDPFYRLRFSDGTTLDARAREEDLLDEIRRLAPADEAGFRRFLAASEELYALGFESLAHRPFDGLGDMLRALPGLVRLRADRSVYRLAARHVQDERLRFALSFHPLFVGGNPFTTTAVYGLISALERRHGVHFVRGGTGQLVEGLVSLITGQGNAVRLGARVEEILVTRRRVQGVRLADGETIAADVVVSNADPATTYGRLVPSAARPPATVRRLSRARYSMGVFVWYFGTRRRYPEVPHHTILVGPRYRALLEDIFDRQVLAGDFSLYLHRPTATDASLAPPGCDTFYALSPVPNLRAAIDWTREAEPYRCAIERLLTSTLLPDLPAQRSVSRVLTPLDFRDELDAPWGAAFSLQPLLSQSAAFRPHNRSSSLRHLYLVGAGTHPGAGVPGVLSSARVLDAVVPHAAALD